MESLSGRGQLSIVRRAQPRLTGREVSRFGRGRTDDVIVLGNWPNNSGTPHGRGSVAMNHRGQHRLIFSSVPFD